MGFFCCKSGCHSIRISQRGALHADDRGERMPPPLAPTWGSLLSTAGFNFYFQTPNTPPAVCIAMVAFNLVRMLAAPAKDLQFHA